MAAFTISDLTHIAYHFGMSAANTTVEHTYDPVVITEYCILSPIDSDFPRVIAEVSSGIILFKESQMFSVRYRYDYQTKKIFPN